MSQPTRDNGKRVSPLTDWWERCGGETGGNSHRVRAFVRSFAPAPGRHDRKRQLIEGLQSAADSGLIEQYDVTVIGDRLCCCEHCRSLTEAEVLLEAVTALREWEQQEISSSGFSMRSVESSVTGDHHRVIVPPAISFGIYVDGALAGVFPCTDGDETYRPEAYLDRLLDIRLETSADGTVTQIS